MFQLCRKYSSKLLIRRLAQVHSHIDFSAGVNFFLRALFEAGSILEHFLELLCRTLCNVFKYTIKNLACFGGETCVLLLYGL